jgi:hypothetical protein
MSYISNMNNDTAMTEDDWDEYATYWWGAETDELSVTDAIENGLMTQFILDVLAHQHD